MTKDQLNQYIKHYIEKDLSKSAIMISGEWGSGKSFYIDHTLKPYLEENNHKCIVISLYGLSEIAELSKSIYIEKRVKKLQLNSEAGNTGLIIGTTIVKGITGYFGVDLTVREAKLKKLYNAINLKGTVIILEDVERTKINLFELFGFVNSLVEQEGVKVLLVTNEKELIEYEPINVDNQEERKFSELMDRITDNANRIYTDETKHYLRIKEKTISDTLIFENNQQDVVIQILSEFDELKKHTMNSEKVANEIIEIMDYYRIHNFRVLKYALQKVSDIFEVIFYQEDNFDIDFACSVLYGIIAFSIKVKSGNRIKWDGDEFYSISLGKDGNPLLKFCFDYIMTQKPIPEDVGEYKKALEEYRLYQTDSFNNDEDMRVLNNYYTRKATEVIAALESIKNRLKKMTDIPYQQLGRIAYFTVRIKELIDYDNNEIKALLIDNVKGKEFLLSKYALFPYEQHFETDSGEKEYTALVGCMTEALKENNGELFDFSYNQEDLEAFHSKVLEETKSGFFVNSGAFAARLNTDKLIQLIADCSAAQIDSIRHIFNRVYEASNIGDYLSGDYDSICKLKTGLSIANFENFDEIQNYQISMLDKNLEDISRKLQQDLIIS